MLNVKDYFSNKNVITECVINIQRQDPEHLINHLENYITFHLMVYLAFNIAFNLIYVNQFICELYSTIFEKNFIKNVWTLMTSYQDIKIDECYITFSDTDILSYIITSIVELINTIQETRDIIYEEVILSAYVFIKTSVTDNLIKEMEEISSLNITIMKIEETSLLDNIIMEMEEIKEHILVDILISRVECDVVTNFWPSHREGV